MSLLKSFSESVVNRSNNRGKLNYEKLYELLEKEPQEGTEDIIVNFIRPKYTQGILVELIQQVGDINYDATFTSRWGNEK